MDSQDDSVVRIISVECIKPSTPTPRHLKTHKLSFLDQSIPFPIYGQMALFYHFKNCSRVVPGDADQRSDLLKRSLSQTLSLFYPLAGRLIDHLSVDCNDVGVQYVDARVKTTMLNFLSQPDNSLIPKFHSCDNPWLNFRSNPCLNNVSLAGAPVAFVQANVFECGSVAIGVSVNHMLLDGFALTTFIKCWGDIARGGHFGDQIPDFITGPSLFPQNEALPKASSASLVEIGEQNPVTKRFVFNSSDLAKLKARATTSLVQRPTRFEVATALIWKCVLAAFRANSGVQKASLLGYIVNLRQRTELPISNNTMGNVVGVILAASSANAETTYQTGDLAQLVEWIRESKKTLKPDPLKDFVGDGGFTNYCEYLKKSGEAFRSAQNAYNGGCSVEFLSVTGLLNSGIYETDFGWGKPEWATTSIVNQEVAPSAMNTVMLMDTKCGNGVEAWVKLDEKNMALLQRNQELLEFSCVDPSPLRPSPSNARM